jgi:dihydropteroate synthase
VLATAFEALWTRRRPLVMGILNVTPDSFAETEHAVDPEAAVALGLRLAREGADILDVGGESTRPGALPVPAELEAERVVPVVAELARRLPGVLISTDTTKPDVAALALAAGASIVNDISAGRAPGMLELAAEHRATVILMHMRGTPATMQQDTRYADVVAEVHGLLLERARAAVAAGVPAAQVWLDPGIGFGKDLEGNLRLVAALPDLAALGHPVVLGASRKSFIGQLTRAAVQDRLPGSLAALASAARLGRAVVRVHDVAATVQYLTVLEAIGRAA